MVWYAHGMPSRINSAVCKPTRSIRSGPSRNLTTATRLVIWTPQLISTLTRGRKQSFTLRLRRRTISKSESARRRNSSTSKKKSRLISLGMVLGSALSSKRTMFLVALSLIPRNNSLSSSGITAKITEKKYQAWFVLRVLKEKTSLITLRSL